MKSMSHSTHTKQVPFASGQAKELERQLQLGARPGTPLQASLKEQPTSQVALLSWVYREESSHRIPQACQHLFPAGADGKTSQMHVSLASQL